MGIAVPFVPLDAIEEGYTLMNEALKEYIESIQTDAPAHFHVRLQTHSIRVSFLFSCMSNIPSNTPFDTSQSQGFSPCLIVETPICSIRNGETQ